MPSLFQKASDVSGYAYDSRLIGPIVWAFIWLAVAFCAIHAIRRARANPAPKPPARYNFNQKLYHWRNFMGWTREYPAPGKYGALQKVYHHILSLLAIAFVISGTLMWLSASRIYLSARGLIHFCRQVHDLSALCLVVMVVAHFYFSIIKVNRQNLRDMAGLTTDEFTTEAQRHGE